MSAHEGECSYLFQPLDDDGRPQDREHCRICGKPRTDPVVSALRDIAWNFIAAKDPQMADGLISIAGRLESVLRGEDAAPAPRTYTEWGVAYEGGEQPGRVFGIREYDDREDAETIIAMGLGDVLVTRTVTATPWQRVSAEVPRA